MSWKDILFEKELTAPQTQPAQSIARPVDILQPTAAVLTPAPITAAPASGELAAMTEHIQKRTDFETTDAGKLLKRHLEPLEGTPLTEAQKVAVAMKAGARDGLTTESLLQAIAGVLYSLENEKSNFDLSAQREYEEDVAGCEKAIADEDRKIQDYEKFLATSRARRATLAEDLDTKKAKIEGTRVAFNLAYESRKTELKTMQSRYTELLKG